MAARHPVLERIRPLGPFAEIEAWLGPFVESVQMSAAPHEPVVRVELRPVWFSRSWSSEEGVLKLRRLRGRTWPAFLTFFLTADGEDRADRHSSGLTNSIESKMARASSISAGSIDSSDWPTAITARSPFRSTTR